MENTEADIAALRSEIEELKEAAERDTKIRLIKSSGQNMLSWSSGKSSLRN